MAYNYYGNPNQQFAQAPYYGYAQQPSYASMPQQATPQAMLGIQWVDGEVGAKAFQMPQGWSVGTPIALWDTNDPIIYLKSVNQMGMPNPLQKIHYTMEEQQNKLPAGSMMSSQESPNYATKDDFEALKNELKDMIKNGQNGSQNNQNRGGTR